MPSPITYVGSTTASGATATVPANNSGDIIIGFGFRDDGTATAPSTPSGWTNIASGAGNSIASRTAYKTADGTTPSVTFTNATHVVLHVYRISSGWTFGIGGTDQKGSASGNVTYNTVSMAHADGSSWVIGFAGHQSVDTSLETPPSGMTNRSTLVDATAEVAGHDTNGGVSSWPTTSVTQGGTSGAYRTIVGELTATQISATGTLAVTETGSDSASMAGAVKVQGTIATSESGADTASCAGKVKVQGSLAATESGADTAALSGQVKVQGSLAASESGNDTAASTGTVAVQGTLAAAEAGADTASASGNVPITGTAALAEVGADTSSASGKVKVSGALAASETGVDTAAFDAMVLVQGAMAATEPGTGTVGLDVAAFLAIVYDLAVDSLPPPQQRFTVQTRPREFVLDARQRTFSVQRRDRAFAIKGN